MKNKSPKIIIEGITEAGEPFRPSDWAERMSGELSTFRKRKMQYSPLLQPSIKGGHKCVIVDPELKTSNPKFYDAIMEFAKTNKLRICEQTDVNTDPEAKKEI
jgi:hypothetical protein